MARAMGGISVRPRYLSEKNVASAPATIWVVNANVSTVQRFHALAPQFLDVINPAPPHERERFQRECREFRYLITNTESTRKYLAQEPDSGWKIWVIPHHHCNFEGWTLPESRLEKPKVVGYIGETANLHDAEAIEAHVKQLGLEFLAANTRDVNALKKMDIGIAWTRREAERDDCRRNIKLSNFTSHGIPSVVNHFESYREVDAKLGGGSSVICDTLDEFLAGITRLASDEKLRREFASKAPLATKLYSIDTIAEMYREMIAEARAEGWSPPRRR